MGLVDYSESEGSDIEQKPAPQKPPKPITNSNKPAFQKVVDRSNPHKILVNLPETKGEPQEIAKQDEEPPAKKQRTGGGAFSGFNSLLPPPKRPAATNGPTGGAGPRRGGLGSGVNLKTGAVPGFSREVPPENAQNLEEDTDVANEHEFLERRIEGENGITPEKNSVGDTSGGSIMREPKEEPRKEGNPMMFKPLSVARKPQKKKAAVTNGATAPKPEGDTPPPQPKVVPKKSLFSTAPTRDDHSNDVPSRGVYRPMIYRAKEPEPPPTEPSQIENPYIEQPNAYNEPPSQFTTAPGPQSLDTIASDLNLSASAKRQLFGRQRGSNSDSASAINVVNFNTDQEYAANELLRQAGEQVQHNPVRAIAPGKHSLKQLVSAASNQKDALEEQFASGRRNKKEAGSKYGW
ncbi:MAG: hypothetical protein Q9218_001676 [Villophora microphyllina]